MQGMLSFLLFAGALHVDINQLRRWRWQVGVLALIGTADFDADRRLRQL